LKWLGGEAAGRQIEEAQFLPADPGGAVAFKTHAVEGLLSWLVDVGATFDLERQAGLDTSAGLKLDFHFSHRMSYWPV